MNQKVAHMTSGKNTVKGPISHSAARACWCIAEARLTRALRHRESLFFGMNRGRLNLRHYGKPRREYEDRAQRAGMLSGVSLWAPHTLGSATFIAVVVHAFGARSRAAG
jgi:hypothetical protein